MHNKTGKKKKKAGSTPLGCTNLLTDTTDNRWYLLFLSVKCILTFPSDYCFEL